MIKITTHSGKKKKLTSVKFHKKTKFFSKKISQRILIKK